MDLYQRLICKVHVSKKYAHVHLFIWFLEIDPNQMEHAKFCAGELYNAVQEKKYEMALSFLRGFREVFANSRDMNIRRIYTSKLSPMSHRNDSFFK